MSHLFKKNYKKIYKFFIISIFFIIIALSYLGLQKYSGNKINYLSFTFISNFLILFATRKRTIFFETFFSLFLWLGFWFKFTCTIVFTDGVFREGVGIFDYSKESFDETLLISQIGILAFIISGFFREYFIFNYPRKLDIQNFKYNFFSFGRKNIWIFFIIFFIAIACLNFYFKIYQKGLMPIYEINFLISGIFKWLLLFGLSAFSANLIFYEFNFYKKFFFISLLIITIETFFTSFSMLSRGMIFNVLALLLGIYKLSNKANKPNDINYYIKSIIFVFILFYISISSVNYIRANYFYVGKSSIFAVNKFSEVKEVKKDEDKKIQKKYATTKAINSEILYLIINRWVGIDGVMSIISKKDLLNTPFLLSSFNERASKDMPTFYELTFELKENKVSNELYENVKGNTLPGVLAFSYYSGSYYILFLIIFSISIFASCLEYLSFKFSSNNLILASLIGQVIAFRFAHFGYLPHQSYLLFGSIILTIILSYILSLCLKKI
ncbi:hypothetical protein PQY92_01990 [Candidatus Pelagibacter sp.]|nr:hypothetical protein [Candidatus Pelagibacter sp.]